MQYGRVEGVDKKISRLVLGTMIINTTKKTESFELLDEAVELGWNTLDTAYVYCGGDSERVIGQWMQERGNREQMVIIGKGAAGNADRKRRLTPFDISHDLYDTLARLQTSYVDLYILHRDDPNQPVGPIVEALNEHISKGRIRAIGGSNWTSERLEAANEYAYAHHLVPFRASSPNFSLAEQVVNPWADSDVTLSGNKGKKEREWHQKSQIAVFSWSSMARGFWSGRFNRQTFSAVKENLDPWCVKAYCHETNFARLDRVEALSAFYHVTVPQIAVAYIMHQSLNIFAIIGAASKEELMASIVGLTLPLTQYDMDWIDLTVDTHPVLG